MPSKVQTDIVCYFCILVNIIYIVECVTQAIKGPDAVAQTLVSNLLPLPNWLSASNCIGNHLNRIWPDGALSELQRCQALDVFQHGIGAFQ